MPLCYGNEWVMISSNRIPLLTQFWPYVSRCFLLSFFRIIFLVRHSCPVHTQSTSKREHSLSFDVCPRMPPNLGNKQGSKYTRVGMNFDFRHLRFRTSVSDFFIRNINVRFFYFGHQWTPLDSFHPYPRRLECLTICRCRSTDSPRMPPNLGNKQGSKYTRVGMNFDFRHLRFRTSVSDFFIRNINVRFFYFGHQWTPLDSFHPYPRRLECLTICRCRSEGSTFPSYFKTLSVGAVKVLNPRPPARHSGALQHELTRQRLCGICGTRQVFCFLFCKSLLQRCLLASSYNL